MKPIIFLSMLLTAGCFSSSGTGHYGGDFDIAKAESIKEGVTTKSQILTSFGEPQTHSVTDSIETWIYTYALSKVKTSGSMFGATSDIKTNYKTLLIVFNPDGTVKTRTVSQSDMDSTGKSEVK